MPRPFPVLNRKGVERERLDPKLRTGFNGCSHGINSGSMPENPRVVSLPGPAPVPIHDDRYVSRNTLWIELGSDLPLRIARIEDLKQMLHSTKLYGTPRKLLDDARIKT